MIPVSSAVRYRRPATVLTFSEEIQKSRFLTWIGPTTGRSAAQAWIAGLREAHPHARHCCWASIAEAPQDGQGYGCSDDGEPAGTAGRPMLALLQGSGLGAVSAVVVRYYGGILLGTGGLVRAYTHGVSQLLQQMPVCEQVLQRRFLLHYGYEDTRLVERCLLQHQAESLSMDYLAEIQLRGQCPYDCSDALAETLRQQSRGRLQLCWEA